MYKYVKIYIYIRLPSLLKTYSRVKKYCLNFFKFFHLQNIILYNKSCHPYLHLKKVRYTNNLENTLIEICGKYSQKRTTLIELKRNTGIPTLGIDTLNAKCTKYLAENDNYACSKQDGGQNKRDGDFQNFHVDYSKTAASRKRQQAEIHSVSKKR